MQSSRAASPYRPLNDCVQFVPVFQKLESCDNCSFLVPKLDVKKPQNHLQRTQTKWFDTHFCLASWLWCNWLEVGTRTEQLSEPDP